MIKIIPFHHWVMFTRNHVFPRVKSRSHLIRLFDAPTNNDPFVVLDNDANANLLWSEYIEWHCKLSPVKRDVTFKTWCKSIREFDNEHERAFAADIDRDFPPVHDPDFIVDYLTELGAVEEAIDAFERLWIKYCNH